MTEFKLGNRVRVRHLPGTGITAGHAGAVRLVERDDAGTAVIYLVRLDADPENFNAEIDIPFLPDELEPEPVP